MTAITRDIINKYQGLVPNQVLCAVQNAAQRTGADFAYLMDKACTESSFNPAAKSKGSSATGLFQFIESTWLSLVRQHGAKFGLEAYAEKIEMKGGRPVVSDPEARREILALRKNPEISALMAATYSKENACYLERKTGCDVGATELYLAHFLGAGGAAKFINASKENPNAVAAQLFPEAARANRNVFFDKETGRARTLGEIYGRFANKFRNTDGAPPSPAPRAAQRSVRAPALPGAVPLPATARQAPPLSLDEGLARLAGTKQSRAVYVPKVSPAGILAMAEMIDHLPAPSIRARKDRYGYNS